jgi:hypothetical protein
MAGWLTRNEARELEELNPIDGLDEPLQPLNMVGINEEPEPVVSNDSFVEDVAGRIAMAEERGLSVRADKASEDKERFIEWVGAFYEKQESYVAKCLSPLTNSESIVNAITVSGILSINMSESPTEHIKSWNRKQEITDIIKEAMLCIQK